MQESNIGVIQRDLKPMVENARALFHAATTLTGNKAIAVRKRGMRLLDIALANAHAKKAFATNHDISELTDDVKDNPWHAIAAAAGFGLIAGVIMGLNN